MSRVRVSSSAPAQQAPAAEQRRAAPLVGQRAPASVVETPEANPPRGAPQQPPPQLRPGGLDTLGRCTPSGHRWSSSERQRASSRPQEPTRLPYVAATTAP